ncbi:hypothetical protein HHK36_016907 [Tetracentron sinense]|uniref:Uncharacterized protein n=1 Tax=Tetracentron sinense TaxID=13715 RepID=A0A835DCC6_TETSI|nr:hypothetical protein HHK36_016907 [Tetracentron sinense]
MEGEDKWSEAVEELVDRGDIDGAISLLESVISKLETPNSSQSDLQLASALGDLANLYSSRGFSLKSDELQTRAFLIKQRPQQIHPLCDLDTAKMNDLGENRVSPSDASLSNACNASDDGVQASRRCLGDYDANKEIVATMNKTNLQQWRKMEKKKKVLLIEATAVAQDLDWEAIADHALNQFFSPQDEVGVSKLSLEDTEIRTPKRRGRGTFLYGKDGLYSDQQADVSIGGESDDEVTCPSSKGDTEIRN